MAGLNQSQGSDAGATAHDDAPSPQLEAFSLCAGVIAGPPPTTAELPSHNTLITTRWTHHELHDVMPAIPVHTIATYHGVPAHRVWQCGRHRFSGTGRPGSVAVIPAGWGGYWDIEGKSSVSYVFLSDARLQSFAEPFAHGRQVDLVTLMAEPDPMGGHLLRALSREAARPERTRRLFVEQTMDLLLMHLLRAHSSLGRPAALPAPRRGLPTWQVGRVMSYMSERLDQDISLDELAALTSLSRSHFCTAFREATGRTPHACLTRLRLERARRLLSKPGLGVTEVALMVGYQTPSAFAAAFRRHVGVTPSDYRRGLGSG